MSDYWDESCVKVWKMFFIAVTFIVFVIAAGVTYTNTYMHEQELEKRVQTIENLIEIKTR